METAPKTKKVEYRSKDINRTKIEFSVDKDKYDVVMATLSVTGREKDLPAILEKMFNDGLYSKVASGISKSKN